MLATSRDWAKQPKHANIIILDPDGWDRLKYEFSFGQELISEEEFLARRSESTVMCIK